MGRPLAARADATRAELQDAEAHRALVAEQRNVAATETRSYRIAIIPHNDDVVGPLPPARREALEAGIRRALAKARSRRDAVEQAPSHASSAIVGSGNEGNVRTRPAHDTLKGATCAACRGACCRLANESAFIDADTMLRYLREYPEHDDDTIVARYLSHLGRETMTQGCVYQQSDGCSLPRDLRADICNRFYCDAFTRIREPYATNEPVRAYFVHRIDEGLVGGQFVEFADDQPEHPINDS